MLLPEGGGGNLAWKRTQCIGHNSAWYNSTSTYAKQTETLAKVKYAVGDGYTVTTHMAKRPLHHGELPERFTQLEILLRRSLWEEMWCLAQEFVQSTRLLSALCPGEGSARPVTFSKWLLAPVLSSMCFLKCAIPGISLPFLSVTLGKQAEGAAPGHTAELDQGPEAI